MSEQQIASTASFPELLTYQQAARRVGVHPALLRREVSDGNLPVFVVRGRRLFATADLAEWLKRCRVTAQVA